MSDDIFTKFKEFINSFDADPHEVGLFVYSLLCENGRKSSVPTGLYGDDYILYKEECV